MDTYEKASAVGYNDCKAGATLDNNPFIGLEMREFWNAGFAKRAVEEADAFMPLWRQPERRKFMPEAGMLP